MEAEEVRKLRMQYLAAEDLADGCSILPSTAAEKLDAENRRGRAFKAYLDGIAEYMQKG